MISQVEYTWINRLIITCRTSTGASRPIPKVSDGSLYRHCVFDDQQGLSSCHWKNVEPGDADAVSIFHHRRQTISRQRVVTTPNNGATICQYRVQFHHSDFKSASKVQKWGFSMPGKLVVAEEGMSYQIPAAWLHHEFWLGLTLAPRKNSAAPLTPLAVLLGLLQSTSRRLQHWRSGTCPKLPVLQGKIMAGMKPGWMPAVGA